MRLNANAVLGCATLCTGLACAAEPSIAGRWTTFDADGRKHATVEIAEEGGQAIGRIVELFLQPDEDRDPICVDCPGDARGRRIRGLEILKLRREAGGARWRGTVLDPEEGRLYRGTATPSADGRTLRLRGFVGFELFGRTEKWTRAD